LFSKALQNKKGIKWAAWSWTLFLFLLCLLPGHEIPDVNIPLVDKWVHFVLFAIFSLLWLLAYPSTRWRLLLIFILSVSTGWLVEELQGLLTMLGRSKDVMDILADGIGGGIGVVVFWIWWRRKI
jgi:VanZ family protein